MNPDSPAQNTTTDRIFEVWSRRKWLAILTFLPLAVASVSGIRALPNLYTSTAVVVVDRQQVPEEFVRSTVTSALETRLNTINQELLGRPHLEQLIATLGLYPDLRKRVSSQELIERMRRDIKFDPRGTEARAGRPAAFALSYTGPDPDTVAQVANALASFYVEENLRARGDQASGTESFLRAQLEQVKGRLDEQERRVSEFKKRFAGGLPQEFEVNLATLERLNAQLRLNSDSQTRVLDRREALARQLAAATSVTSPVRSAAEISAPAPELRAPAPDPMTLRLVQLRQELAELQTRFSDKYPDIIRARSEIAALERQIAGLPPRPLEAAPVERPVERPISVAAPDPQLPRLREGIIEAEAELKTLKAEERRIRETMADYQQRVQETPVREQQYKELARDYDATKELYGSLLKRHTESRIAESMEQDRKGEQFRVMEVALPAPRPSAPNRRSLLLLGLGFASGAALLVVLLAEKLNPGFHTVEDLRTFTSVPVLVSIPRIIDAADRGRARRVGILVAASTVGGLVLVARLSYWLALGNERLVSFLVRQQG